MLSLIPHHISHQIVDPEIPPQDPVWWPIYFGLSPPPPPPVPPLLSLTSKLLELQNGQYPCDFFFEGTISLIIWLHDSDSTKTHKTISESYLGKSKSGFPNPKTDFSFFWANRKTDHEFIIMLIYFSWLAYISCTYDNCCPKGQVKNPRTPELNICLIVSVSFL